MSPEQLCSRFGKPFFVSERPKAGRPRRWCSRTCRGSHLRNVEPPRPATQPSPTSKKRSASTNMSGLCSTSPVRAAEYFGS